MSNTVFSVVDIETTGSSQSNGNNRIIQFSCTFVQNNKIIGSFNSFINPEMEIPNEITKLTGISNKTVEDSPTFSEVADQIYNLLKNTVFVAHNVNFDFPFINLELERSNHKLLTNKAIDTVTLSQLLLPTESSYKLTDLSKSLNIIHKHPHSSSSDALATAKILIILLHQLENLPKATVKQILDINPSLPMNTIDMFKRAFNLKKDVDNPKIKNIRGLQVRKIKYRQDEPIEMPKYPNNKRKKQKMFSGIVDFTLTENKLMNSIYGNYHSKKVSNKLLIEENDEFNYDFGYLFPLSYLLKSNQKIIIAADEDYNGDSSIITQINKLNKINNTKLKCIVLHSISDYIDLDKFANTLKVQSSSKNTQFLKCKILVWLTFTKTGDINELRLKKDNNQNYFLNVVSDEQNHGYYIKRLSNDFNTANIVLVSHNYLLTHAKELSTNNSFLVIKDSRQLAKHALNYHRVNFSLSENRIVVNHIVNMLYQTHNRNIYDIFQHSKAKKALVKKLENIINKSSDQIENIKDGLVNDFYAKKNLIKVANGYTLNIDDQRFAKFINSKSSLFKSLGRNQQTCLDLIDSLKRKMNHFSGEDKGILYAFFDKINEYMTFIESNILRINSLVKHKDPTVFALFLNEDKDIQNAMFKGGMIRNKNILSNDIYSVFNKIIFLDSSVYSSKRSQFFYDQLELKRKNTRMIKFEDETNLNDKFKLILDESLQIPMPIEKLMQYNSGNVFILAESQSRINEISRKLKDSSVNENTVILSQELNRNNSKVVKKFISSRNNIVIGDNELLEELKEKHKFINILIIDSLSINEFDNIYLQAEYDLINKEYGNPNDGLSIPLGIINIKEAIKNIISLSNGKGIIYLRDKEIVDGPYGNNLFELIPNHIKPTSMNKREIIDTFKKL